MASYFSRLACAAGAATALALLASLPAIANPHGNSGMGVSASHAVGVPPAMTNPNGQPPVGKPGTHGPDTDRGMSEGKGRTDTATSKSRAPMKATLTTLTSTTATVRFPNGTVQTFMIAGDTFRDLRGHVGKRVVFRTSSGTLIPVTNR